MEAKFVYIAVLLPHTSESISLHLQSNTAKFTTLFIDMNEKYVNGDDNYHNV